MTDDSELNDIDFLMNLDPCELSTKQEDGVKRKRLDAIIALHRNHRAHLEAGGKRPKKDTGPAQKIDLLALGLKPATPSIKRRI
jgi:hypothetical protein